MEDGARKTVIPGEGTIEMVKVGDQWKIAKESWSFDLNLAYPIFDAQPFMQEGQRVVAQKVFEGHASAITQVAHTRDWRSLITISSGDYSLRVWDFETGQELSMKTLGSRPTSLALSPDGRYVLTEEVGTAPQHDLLSVRRSPGGLRGQRNPALEHEELVLELLHHARSRQPDPEWPRRLQP